MVSKDQQRSSQVNPLKSTSNSGFNLSEQTYYLIWDVIANIWFVGFFFGIWLSPVLNDRYGRKAFIITNIINLGTSICRFCAIVWFVPELLLFSRFFSSLATAVTYQTLILFLQECSPTRLRGFIGFTSEVGYSSMTLLGMFLGMESIWGHDLRILVGSAILPSFFAVLVLLPIHETPKFLLIVKRNKVAATKSIRFYQGPDANTDAILHEIAQEVDSTKNCHSSLLEIIRTPHLLKAVMLGCLALQNTIALWAILLSSTDFLRQVNVEMNIAQWSSTGMTLCYSLGTVVGLNFVERFGRRFMTLVFSSITTTLLVTYVLFSQLASTIPLFKFGCLLCLMLYGFTYGFGVGPIPWFLSSELAPQRHRSLVQSTCYSINTIMVIFSTFTILPLFKLVGSFSFLILYVIPSIFSIVMMYLYLPETKGREVHEIVADLRRNAH